MASLWGEEFEIPKTAPKKTIRKVQNAKEVKIKTTTQKLNSRTLSMEDRLVIVKAEVERVLGRYETNTQVIRTKDELIRYIDHAIENGEIAIDTETNNSLDPITCKLMGPCIYTPGEKNAYIPLNHVDPNTLIRLDNQLTEEDIAEQFSRLANTKIIMHNGKFDYEVIKCTCGVKLNIYWDTMIGAKILDENELSAGLKQQYISKIDSSVEKYSIDHLFKDVEYAVVDPELFALYAATDAYMTYLLYKYQEEQFNKVGNEKLKYIFQEVEMPVVEVVAELELMGVCIDSEYAHRLSNKYHKMIDETNTQIDLEILKYSDQINAWRSTSEANYKPTSTKPNKNGEYTLQKSKNEQLADPPQISSPTQFAILLYDVLKTPVVDKKSPRGTGEDILEKIGSPLCKLVLQKRGLDKLIGTYIDKLPECVNPKDNRLHAKFSQLGAATGRFSSQDPNLQNIPSGEKAIRMMFKATDGEYEIKKQNNCFILDKWDEVETNTGWKKVYNLTTNDILNEDKILQIENLDGVKYKVVVE